MKINTQKKTIKKLLSFALTVSIITTSFTFVVQASAQTVDDASNQTISEIQKTVSQAKSTKEFVIRNKDDFSKFMRTSKYWGNNYKITLACDINMQDETFDHINEFSGVFDGCGHTISNLKIQNSSKKDEDAEVAFIKTLNSLAEIKNITFDNYNIKHISIYTCLRKYKLSSLVINNHGNILGVNFKNEVITNNKYVEGYTAGFVFNNYKDGIIKNCHIKNVNAKDSKIKSGFVEINHGKITNSSTTISVNTL